jgi:hypothetical protein
MNILLGIFAGPHFGYVMHTENVSTYPFTDLIPDIFTYTEGIVSVVLYASHRVNKIIFLIDGIKPNITGDEKSYTCQELISILHDPIIPISKIEFREDNVVVSCDYVLIKLNLI